MYHKTIVILNYNTYEHTSSLISNIIKMQSKKKYNIIVVDNSKNIKKRSILQNNYLDKSNIHFVSPSFNGGYASGNNYGIKYLQKKNLLGDFIFVINPDIIIESDIFDKLIDEYKSEEKCGIIGPKIILNNTNYIQGPYKKENIIYVIFENILPFIAFIRRFFDRRWRNRLNKLEQVHRTMGCFLLFDKKIFIKINGFDEATFLGYEEDILSERLRKINKYFYYCPKYHVLHDHMQSFQDASEIKKMLYHYKDSQVYYYKNYIQANSFLIKLLNLTSFMKIFYKISEIKIKNAFNN